MPDRIRVLLADDQHMVRAGLRQLLEREEDIEVVGEAADGEQAIVQARSLAPDVILLDLIMPRKSGLVAIIAIKQHTPDARILVLTGFASDHLVLEAIRAGAVGYLLKTASVDQLAQAIRTVYAGETPLHPTAASKLIRELVQSPR
jgi:NarL family two-component system response regulator LiaR